MKKTLLFTFSLLFFLGAALHAATVNVTWVNDANVSITGNSLIKAGGSCWTSGASSAESFSGDLTFEFTATESNRLRMVGVSPEDKSVHYSTIAFAIYLHSNKNVYIYESGRSRGIKSTYVDGDIFQVVRTGSTISYQKNNVEFYQSGNSSVGGLLADVSLCSTSATVTDAKFHNVTVAVPGVAAELVLRTGDTQVEVSWPLPANNGAVLTGVQPFFRKVGDAAWTSFGAALGGAATSVTVTGLTNGTNYEFQIVAANVSGVAADMTTVPSTMPGDVIPAVWTNLIGVSVAGVTVTKTAASGWSNGGAASEGFYTGDVTMEWTASETNKNRMVGVSDVDSDAHFTSLDYAFYIIANGTLRIYESGRNKGTFGIYKTGDVFQIVKTGTGVVYRKNGLDVYTSLKASATPWRADCAFHTVGGTLTDMRAIGATLAAPSKITALIPTASAGQVKLTWQSPANNGSNIIRYNIFKREQGAAGFDAAIVLNDGSLLTHDVTGLTNGTTYEFKMTSENGVGVSADMDFVALATPDTSIHAQWQNLVTVTATGNSLLSTGPNGWSTSGASSLQFFEGDMTLDITIASLSGSRMVGLSDSDSDTNYTTLDYAFYLISGGRLYIYESGRSRGQVGTYLVGDNLQVIKAGTTITYRKNGVDVYTSAVVSNTALMADTAFYSTNSRVSNARILGATEAVPGAVRNLAAKAGDTEVPLTWLPAANNGHAILRYEIEYGTLGNFDEVFVDDNVSGATIPDLINGTEYNFRVVAYNSFNVPGKGTTSSVVTMIPEVVEDIVWIDLVGAVGQGSLLTKTGANGWGLGGAASFTSFDGDGALELTVGRVTGSRMVGLSAKNTDANFTTIDYAFYLFSNSRLRIYEKGRYKAEFGPFALGDVLSLYRIGSTIEYRQNNVTFYTSLTASDPEVGLMADAALYHIGTTVRGRIVGVETGKPGRTLGTIAVASNEAVSFDWLPAANNRSAITSYEIHYGPVYSGAFTKVFVDDGLPGATINDLANGTEYQFKIRAINAEGQGAFSDVIKATPVNSNAIVWTDFVGAFELNTILTKTAVSGWANGGAASTATLDGNGGLNFRADETNRNRMVGLSANNVNAHYNTIDYAFYISSSVIRVYEKGRHRGAFGAYSRGDYFKVERLGSTIYYKKNNEILYTSTIPVAKTVPLFADVAMHTVNATVADASFYIISWITNFKGSSASSAIAPGALASTATITAILNWDNISTVQDPTFSGSKIRVSTDSFPDTLSEGAELGSFNATTSTTTHTNLLSETTYYYSIFGHDVGLIFDAPLKISVTTPDLIEPDAVSGISIEENVDSVILQWTNPDKTVYPNQDFVGVKIVRSTTANPSSVEDGVLVATLSANEQSYIDSEVTGKTTYFYSLFTFDDVPFYSEPISVSATPLAASDRLVIVPAGTTGNFDNPSWPTQVAGTSIAMQILALDADGQPLAWVSGSKNVDLSFGYVGASAKTLTPLIDEVPLPSTLNLNFTAGISSTFSVTYRDVGQIDFSAQLNDTELDGDGQLNTKKSQVLTYNPLGIELILDTIALDDSTTQEGIEIASRAFSLKGRMVASDDDNTDLSDNPVTPSFTQVSAALSLNNTTNPAGNDSTSPGSATFVSGLFELSEVLYNDVGEIEIIATANYNAQVYTGTTESTRFRAHSMSIGVKHVSTQRQFFYLDEDIPVTVTMRDFLGQILPNYSGTIAFESVDHLDEPKTYVFGGGEGGSKEFKLKGDKVSSFKLKVSDQQFATKVNAESVSIEVKSGVLIVDPLTASPVGQAKIRVQMLDQFDILITDDSDTTFEIVLGESLSNNSATLVGQTGTITLKNGVATLLINDTESERVTVTPANISAPVKGRAGEITYGGLRKGKIRRFYWIERRKRAEGP